MRSTSAREVGIANVAATLSSEATDGKSFLDLNEVILSLIFSFSHAPVIPRTEQVGAYRGI